MSCERFKFYCFLQILSTRLRDTLKKEPYSPTPASSLPVQPHQPQQQYHDATPDSQRREDAGRMDQPTSYYQPSEIPFDPSLVCPKCGRQFHRGEIQKSRKHCEECSGNQPTSSSVRTIEMPYDPNLVCPKCGRQFCRGEIQKAREHHEWCSGLVDEMLTL